MALQSEHIYCTYFDEGYLPRALTLISSLRENGDSAPIFILALDDSTFAYFESAQMTDVHVVTMVLLEEQFPELLTVKSERTRMEYLFTTTPFVIRAATEHLGKKDSLTIYLDADLYFFGAPTRVIDAMGTASTGIIEHRYPRFLEKRLAKYGKYNVGWVAFRNDQNGSALLDWYAAATLEWCHDRPEHGKYADQGYLDQFLEFPGVAVLPDAGFNLAPWNTARHHLTVGRDNGVLVDGTPLTFFHFHGVRKVGGRYFTAQLVYWSPLGAVLKTHVYRPYLEKLEANEILVNPTPTKSARHQARGKGLSGFAFRFAQKMLRGLAILLGQSFVISDTSVIK